jgi:hypothetical protein
VLEPAGAEASRMNVVLADDDVLASTAYEWSRMLGHAAGHEGTPLSRDSGVLLGGADAARAEAALRATDVGGTALRLLDARMAIPPAAGTAGAHDGAGAVQLLARDLGYQPVDDAAAAGRLVAALS